MLVTSMPNATGVLRPSMSKGCGEFYSTAMAMISSWQRTKRIRSANSSRLLSLAPIALPPTLVEQGEAEPWTIARTAGQPGRGPVEVGDIVFGGGAVQPQMAVRRVGEDVAGGHIGTDPRLAAGAPRPLQIAGRHEEHHPIDRKPLGRCCTCRSRTRSYQSGTDRGSC